MSPPLAHTGHWLVNLVYLGPILVIGLLLLYDRLKRGPDDLSHSEPPEHGEQ